jgi:hypothetical protein
MKREIIAGAAVILIALGAVSVLPTNNVNKLINKVYDYDSEYLTLKTKIIADAEDMNKCYEALTALEQNLIKVILIEKSKGIELTKKQVTEIAAQAVPLIKRFCK